MSEIDLKSYIRDIPDYPKKGILFHDITPLLKSPRAFKYTIDKIGDQISDVDLDYIVGIDARGFIFASALSYKLDKGVILVRKPGKLPFDTLEASYELEYGTDKLEMHKDEVSPGDKVLIADDLLATGGTAKAAGELIEKSGGEIAGYYFLIELTELKGSDKLNPHNIWSTIKFPF